ncbi:MFS transporter [Shewanella sp. OPT22]|nr:MFS transporter [Shewanella sp. OPT22]
MKSKAAIQQFVLLNLGHALNHYLVLIFPTAALFLTKPWNISYPELLKLGSFGAMAYGVSVIPAGWLADKIGRHKMLNIFFIGIGLASVAAGFTQTPTQLGMALIAIGVFGAIYHPVGIALVYRLSDKPGRLLALHGIAGNIGLSMAAIGTAALAHYFSWRIAFILPGVVATLAGFIFIVVSKSKHHATSVESHSEHEQTPKAVIKILSCIVVTSICGGLSSNAFITGLPKILTRFDEFKTDSLTHIGSIVTGLLLFASVSQVVIGELLVRVRPEKLLLSVVFLQVLALAMLNVVPQSMLLIAAILFLTFAQITINDVIIGQRSHDSWRSTVYAVKYTVFLGVAAVAYWLVALSLQHSNNFIFMYQLLAAVTVVSVIFSIFIYQLASSSRISNSN